MPKWYVKKRYMSILILPLSGYDGTMIPHPARLPEQKTLKDAAFSLGFPLCGFLSLKGFLKDIQSGDTGGQAPPEEWEPLLQKVIIREEEES